VRSRRKLGRSGWGRGEKESGWKIRWEGYREGGKSREVEGGKRGEHRMGGGSDGVREGKRWEWEGKRREQVEGGAGGGE